MAGKIYFLKKSDKNFDKKWQQLQSINLQNFMKNLWDKYGKDETNFTQYCADMKEEFQEKRFKIYEDNDRVLAFAEIETGGLPKGHCSIEFLATDPNCQGGGIGTKLLNNIMREYSNITLIPSNKRVKGLYSRLGFKPEELGFKPTDGSWTWARETSKDDTRLRGKKAPRLETEIAKRKIKEV